MGDSLKELLERLIESDDARVLHADCDVEQDVTTLQTRLAALPGEDSSGAAVLGFGLTHLRGAAKNMMKGARKQELELEMRLLDKPDDVDLSSDDHKHTRLHIEEETLQAEILKREGAALLRFCDLVDSLTDE